MGLFDFLDSSRPAGTTTTGHGNSFSLSFEAAELSNYRDDDLRKDEYTGHSGSSRKLAKEAIDDGRDPSYLRY